MIRRIAEGFQPASGLNAQYLLDFMEEAETENVRLELKDENMQCLCRPEDKFIVFAAGLIQGSLLRRS